MSAYVNEAVRRQLRRDALAEMQAANGSVDVRLIEEVRRRWPGRDDGDTPLPE